MFPVSSDEETVFFTVYSCLLCCRLVDHRCVGLFLGSVLLIHMPILVPIPRCLDYCSCAVLSEVWEGYPSSFVLFLQDRFNNSEYFVVP